MDSSTAIKAAKLALNVHNMMKNKNVYKKRQPPHILVGIR